MKNQIPCQTAKRCIPKLSSTPVVLQRQCACGQHLVPGSQCESCGKKAAEVQRPGSPEGAFVTAPPQVQQVLRSPGQPLDSASRTFMETRFGADFSKVRVHTDHKAAESANVINALAYTVGHDVVFGRGQYVPQSEFGKRLLAHELSHVVQQRDHSNSGPLRINSSDDAYEREAERNASAAMAAGRGAIHPQLSSALRIQRSAGSAVLDALLFVPRLLGADYFPADDLRNYLKDLKEKKGPEGGIVSDNKARACVARESELGPYDAQLKIWLIQEMLQGHVSSADENAVIALIRRSITDRQQIVSGIGRDYLWSKFNGKNRRVIEALTLTAADAGDALVKRLQKLNPKEIPDYAENVTDSQVLESINRAEALASGSESPEILARKIRQAFRGPGTDEDEVYRILSYPPEQVRAMINFYNDNLNDHTGKGFVEDVKDEFSGAELNRVLRLLQNAKIETHTIEKTTRIESKVPGEPDKLWAGLIVRGKWSKEHAPGVMEQHADVVVPDDAGKMRTRGFFGDQPGATGSSASIGMGLQGISADMSWFLQNRPHYVDLQLAKLIEARSSLILMKVSKQQAAELNKFWDDLKQDPGTFNILGKNCSTAAAAGFEKADLSKEIVGLDTPDNLFQQLRAKYKDAFMISGYYGYIRAGRKWEMAGGRPQLTNAGAGPWDGPFVVEQRLS